MSPDEIKYHMITERWIQAEQRAKENEEALRDRFAMAALTGMLGRYNHDLDAAARWAYQYADAMMKARNAR